jgi:hypothetical protein
VRTPEFEPDSRAKSNNISQLFTEFLFSLGLVVSLIGAGRPRHRVVKWSSIVMLIWRQDP